MANTKGIKREVEYGAGEASSESLNVWLANGELSTDKQPGWSAYQISYRHGAARAEITTYSSGGKCPATEAGFPKLQGYHPCDGDLMQCLLEAIANY